MAHWDIVLSCFEPIRGVTGGIGTYTRLLLDLLAGHPIPAVHSPRILFLTGDPGQASSGLPSTAHVVHVPRLARVGGLPVENLGGPHAHYAWALMKELLQLQQAGDTFGLAEFPDYGNEGFYALKARAAGLLRLPHVAVRLHSSDELLAEVDGSRARVDTAGFRRFAETRYTYRAADSILFGGDAIRDRTAALLPPELASAFVAKSVKVPHPWPPPRPARASSADASSSARTTLDVGCVGRLQFVKGTDLLVEAALRLFADGPPGLRFHFFGRDTQTFHGQSMRAHLEARIPEALRSAFVFHDYVDQAALWKTHLPAMDAFVFPSRHENYPNALLEVLDLGKPILVSRHGCMPEIGDGFSHVIPFDPEDTPAVAVLLGRLARRELPSADVGTAYRTRKATLEQGALAEVGRLVNLANAAKPVVAPAPAPAAFVVAHYNHARHLPELFDSLAPCLGPEDEVVVVDDASRPDEAVAARAETERRGFRFLQAERNAGPAAARNRGAAVTTCPVLCFIDADDALLPQGVEALRFALAADDALQVATGWVQQFGDESRIWASSDPSPATIVAENCSHVGILIRRAHFLAAGGFREDMRTQIEDWELHMRLVLSGARFESFPVLAYRYRVDLRQGRNAPDPVKFRTAYEQALRSALRSLTPAALVRSWPDLSEQLITRLVSPPPAPTEQPLRYRLADLVNAGLKRVPLHGLLKRAIGRRVAGR